MRRDALGRRFLLAAGAVALVHAAFSFYWALGGGWLLDTVGQWAVRLVNDSPVTSGIVLGVIAVAKVAGGVVPVLVQDDRLPGWRWWRILEGCGAVVLMLYGAANMVVAWAVLAGWITPSGGYDHAAELGHAALWDPLFFLWGVYLALGLYLTRRTTKAGVDGRVASAPISVNESR